MVFLIIFIALVTGVIIGDSSNSLWMGSLFFSLAFICYLLLNIFSDNPVKNLKYNRLNSVWIFFLFSGIGFFDVKFNEPTLLNDEDFYAFNIAEGEVRNIKYATNGDICEVKIERLGNNSFKDSYLPSSLILLVKTDGAILKKGDLITFPLRLTDIFDPGKHNKREADYYNKRRIFYQTNVSYQNIRVTGFNHNIANLASELRDEIEIKIEKSSLSPLSQYFLISLFLGDRSFLKNDIKNNFSNAGIAHILALSGFHVSIMLTVIYFLVFPISFLKIKGGRLIKYSIILLLLWSFVFLSGMAASTLRAAFMATFVILALLLERKNSLFNALIASTYIIILFDPYSIYDIGLQLSFVCVAGLILLNNKINLVDRKTHPKLSYFTTILSTTLTASFCSWILISYYYKHIPLMMIPANLLVLPLLPFYMYAGVFYIILLCFGIDVSFLAFMLDSSYFYIERITGIIADLGTTSINFRFPLISVLLWFVGLFVLMTLTINEKSKALKISFASFLLVAAIAFPFIFKSQEANSIAFLKKSSAITICYTKDDDDTYLTFPFKKTSLLDLKGFKILAVDSPIPDNFLEKYNLLNELKGNLIIILGRNGFYANRDKLHEIFEGYKVLLHPSIHYKSENKFLDELSLETVSNFYSLRKDGVYELALSNR